MTEKLYLNDSYIKEVETDVTSIEENRLRFRDTVFYPTGGGQPCDVGVLMHGGREFKIVEVRKNDEEVDHICEITPDLKSGDSVKLVLDWGKRYAHMRYHTAIHIIDAAVHSMDRPDMIITGSQIYDDHARVDFDFEKLDHEVAQEIIDRANRIIADNAAVKIKDITREEALSIEGLARTEPGRRLIMSLDSVRVIDIEGVDQQADGGTHVASTSEVGKISLDKIKSKGRRNKRMEIHVE